MLKKREDISIHVRRPGRRPYMYSFTCASASVRAYVNLYMAAVQVSVHMHKSK